MKKIIVIVVACISAVYLINPTAGFFELIPDNIPVIGNLDEGVACYLLYSCFEYFRGRKIGIFNQDK